ncbi:MAG: CsgG/HfaB family protein [Proteobacteria bacterium]|nr:CsgG/HfaB family protein [Pseudomonadota bacterium]MCG2831319.1 CsgG/HfaB family protein [Desulfobacteraceae bacterium]MBU4012688.1 CsgG/HfaB family protein [Pseudomonadota bacterium]MBU4069161.1 CsgG/HfaB family protein [Pseudomonadota bacterium]MBU4101586.1 CsgG/HfaB family protein [Pseudomonadota bacterium]
MKYITTKINRGANLRYFGCFTVILFILFSLGCKGPMTYLNPSVDFSYIKRVAVAPIINLTNDKFAGEKVMNVVATEILRRGIFDIVEFGEVSKVLREEGMKPDNLVDKQLAARAGKRLNIEAVIIGSVMQYGVSNIAGSSFPEVSISLKLVDVNSYTILWEATHNIKGANILDQLFGIRRDSLEDLCKDVVEEMIDTLFG